LGLHSGPLTLDPYRHDEVVTRSFLGHVYEGLVGFDAEMALVPLLARHWESPDDLTWRFGLRPGVRFHDGRELTSHDVVASFERARALADDRVSGYLVAVASVRALDALTVELVTVKPYPILLNKLASLVILPAGIGDEPITHPVGTGPYRFVGGAAGGGRWQLEANPDYWRGPPVFRRLEIHAVADGEERVARVLAGELDLVHEVPASAAASLAGDRDVRLVSRPSLTVTYLHLAADRPPFADPRVRRAVSLAIDRAAFVANDFGGFGAPLGQLVTPNVFGHLRHLVPPPRDLASSRSLLAAAGVKTPLSFELELRAGRPYRTLVRQLEEAGFAVRPVVRPWGEMYQRLLAGEVTAYLGGWSCLSGDASDLFDAVLHSRAATGGYGTNNFSRYANPELDLLIAASSSAWRMAERADLLAQAMELAVSDVALVPIATQHNLYAMRSDLAWQPRLDGAVLVQEMGWASGPPPPPSPEPVAAPGRSLSRPAAGPR
jgi:peptide/nickel transport system substrate-binding protein